MDFVFGAIGSHPFGGGIDKQKQAGTGPSRRHIQGSKIAKGLPRVNLQCSKIKTKKWTEWRAGAR